jgi:pilus assembly protein CpaE
VAANLRRLDRDLLDQSVPRHRSGVWVLSQAEKASETELLTPETIGSVVQFLRLQYDHLVLDGVHGFGDVALAALDLADRIVLLVTQEVPAVRNAQRCAEIFQRLGYEPTRIALVVNRFQKGSTITREVIEETVGLPVSATLANDFHAVTRAVNRGVLLWDASPGSALTKDVDALAAELDPETVAQKERRSLIRKLFPSAAVAHGAR